jgi:hypothetical protein
MMDLGRHTMTDVSARLRTCWTTYLNYCDRTGYSPDQTEFFVRLARQLPGHVRFSYWPWTYMEAARLFGGEESFIRAVEKVRIAMA